MRYSSRRSALRGIVQSLLITRHILFAGFSFNDHNFHTIADDVRQAIKPQSHQKPRHTKPETDSPPTVASNENGKAIQVQASEDNINSFENKKFGTALNLVENRLSDFLWGEDLNILSMSKTGDYAQAARKFEIFLDFLLAEVTSTTVFLLRPQYTALLSTEQSALRDLLLKFVSQVDETPQVKQAPEWHLIKNVLHSLGYSSSENVGFIIGKHNQPQ